MPVVLLSGGTGLIGTKLTTHLTERNYDVIILSRKKNEASSNPKVSYSFWDVKNEIIDSAAIQKADHIIHLAGAGVMDKRWTASYKQQIIDSRVMGASLLIKALKENSHHVKTFASASAIGWYGDDSYPLVHKEGFIETDPPAKDFLGETCLLWENSVDEAKQLGIRIVKLRTGIVLSNDGGAFKEFKMPLKFGIAGILGDGKQMISWIHIDDLCRLYIEAIENNNLTGACNAVAPLPVSNKELIIKTAKKIKDKFFIPVHVPGIFIKIFLGKRSTEILKSATVSNRKIKLNGFTFLYPSLESSINNLVKKDFKK